MITDLSFGSVVYARYAKCFKLKAPDIVPYFVVSSTVCSKLASSVSVGQLSFLTVNPHVTK